jgi:hypothetical protein
MAQKLPDKYANPDGYEDEQARRMRAARLEREAYDASWNAAWQAELSKPILHRQWFRSGDLLDESARDPQTLEVNAALRWRIFEKLAPLIQYRQFSDGEVATLSGEVPSFEPLPPPSPGSILVFNESLMLRRSFVRRFIKAYAALPNALPLQQEWFAEFDQAAAAPSPSATINSVEAGTNETNVLERLADWIFSMRRQERRFEKLYETALKDIHVGPFEKINFLAEYQLVYQTKPHRPPATGWPLRSPYKELDAAESLLNKSI